MERSLSGSSNVTPLRGNDTPTRVPPRHTAAGIRHGDHDIFARRNFLVVARVSVVERDV